MNGSWWRVLTKHHPVEKGMANHLSILALRLYEHYEKGKGQDSERGTPQAVGAQYDAGDQWRNNSRKNEGMEPKQEQCDW